MDLVSSACAGVFDELRVPGRVFVGFSGGMDSTVLLHAMAVCERAPEVSAGVVAVHVNHGLSVASDDWCGHCEGVAASLGVEFTASSLEPVGAGSVEARARTARYEIFEGLLGPGDVLVLAHHLEDRDESFLLHLFQGRGVFGMPRRRALGQGMLVRPLLGLPRSTLAAYARSHGLEWLEDPMNLDPAMDRNFLRAEVVPVLKERFQGLSERLDRVIRHTVDTERALIETLGLARHPLPLAVFNGLSHGAKASVLRLWLIECGAAAGISDSALGEFLLQLDADNDRQPELATSCGQLRRYRRHLYLVSPAPVLEAEYPLPAPGALELPHGLLTLARPESESGDNEGRLSIEVGEVKGALRVTFPSRLDPGTALRWKGHDHRVRDVLREAGIPPWRRDSHPLLMDEAGLLAVADVAVRDPREARSAQKAAEGFHLSWNPRPDGGEF